MFLKNLKLMTNLYLNLQWQINEEPVSIKKKKKYSDYD